jgi:DNA repair ATPase RecN
MVEVKIGPLREVVDVVRAIVTDWDVFIRQVDTLTRAHEERGNRCEALEREIGELRQAHEQERREHQSTVAALDELRAGHAALLRQHEELGRAHEDLGRAHHELRERHSTLEQDRQYAADELEALLRRLKS